MAPDADAGAMAVTVDGEPVESEVSRVDNTLNTSVAGVSITFSGVDANGTRVPLDDNGVVRLKKGDAIEVLAAGFTPGTNLETSLRDGNTALGTLKTDSTGGAKGVIPVPASVKVGENDFVVKGTNASGEEVVSSVGFIYGSEESTFNRWLIILPLVFAAFVALMVPASRRRKSASTADSNG